MTTLAAHPVEGWVWVTVEEDGRVVTTVPVHPDEFERFLKRAEAAIDEARKQRPGAHPPQRQPRCCEGQADSAQRAARAAVEAEEEATPNEAREMTERTAPKQPALRTTSGSRRPLPSAAAAPQLRRTGRLRGLDDDIIDRLLQREGGYVDRPQDKGGPTRWGITIPILRRWRQGIGGYVPDTPVNAREAIRSLTKAEAKAIYRELFLKRHNLHLVRSPELREHMLDCVVLHGAKAVRWLQKAAGVEADGIVGPVTLKHVNRTDSAILTVGVFKERARHMVRTVARDPTQLVFLRGWMERALAFI